MIWLLCSKKLSKKNYYPTFTDITEPGLIPPQALHSGSKPSPPLWHNQTTLSGCMKAWQGKSASALLPWWPQIAGGELPVGPTEQPALCLCHCCPGHRTGTLKGRSWASNRSKRGSGGPRRSSLAWQRAHRRGMAQATAMPSGAALGRWRWRGHWMSRSCSGRPSLASSVEFGDRVETWEKREIRERVREEKGFYKKGGAWGGSFSL